VAGCERRIKQLEEDKTKLAVGLGVPLAALAAFSAAAAFGNVAESAVLYYTCHVVFYSNTLPSGA